MAYALRCLTEAVVDWRGAVQRLLFQPLVYLLVFGGVLGGTKLGGGDYAQVVAPGIVAIVVMNSAMAVVGGMFVTGYYFHAMEAWLLGPISLRGFLGALVAGATVMATLAGTAALALIRLVLELSPAEPLLALAAIVFGGLAFSLLFVTAFALPRTPDKAQSVLAFVMMPMMFFGCTFYGWDSLAWPWNALALLMPTTYLSEALRTTYGSSAIFHAGPWPAIAGPAVLAGLAVLSDHVFRRRFRDFPW